MNWRRKWNGCLALRLSLAGWLVGSAVGLTQDPEPIALPKPRMDGGKPLLQALKERKSIREFSRAPVSRQLLSELLWAAFGVNRPENAHRTAPSAMNSQEIDLYVATAEGISLYDARAHQLRPVVAGDWRTKTGGQDFVKDAPVALVFVAELARLEKAKPEDRERYAWMDAGYISQNVYLFCASAGLGTVVHELDRRGLRELLKLKETQQIILAQSVGFPKALDTNAGGGK